MRNRWIYLFPGSEKDSYRILVVAYLAITPAWRVGNKRDRDDRFGIKQLPATVVENILFL